MDGGYRECPEILSQHLAVLIVVAGVGGYFAGSSATPPPLTVTSTAVQTVTVTAAAATVAVTTTVAPTTSNSNSHGNTYSNPTTYISATSLA